MNARAVIKYVAIALLLGAAGFTLAVGAMTLVFAPRTGAYAPTSSSDAASWIQAVGSIGAIIGAFLIGERQAKRERKSLDEARDKAEQDRQEAQLAVIKLLFDLGERFERAYGLNDPTLLRVEWDTAMKNNVRAALHAFDAMPLHEMKSSGRVLAAAEVRSAVQSVYDLTARIMDVPITTDDEDFDRAFRNAKSESDIYFAALAVAGFYVDRQWSS